MDKKIWAIIAIIALHLTLMWFIRGSLKPEEVARANDVSHPDAAPIEPNPYIPVMPVTADVGGTDSAVAFQPIANRKAATLVTRVRSKPLPEAITAQFVKPQADQSYAGGTPLFKDTVIVIKRAEVQPIYLAESPKAAAPQPNPVADITPIKKRKSLFKRVVRKPYDWIKTLVSKL